MTKQDVKGIINEMMPIIIEKVSKALSYETDYIKKLKTIGELAKMFRVSKVTIHAWINEGNIEPAWTTPGGRSYYDPRDFNIRKAKLFNKAYNACN